MSICLQRVVFCRTSCNLQLTLRCAALAFTINERIAVKAADWMHEVNRKARFQLRKPTMQKHCNDYTMQVLVNAIGPGDQKITRVDEMVHFEWEKEVVRRNSSTGVLVNNMNVNSQGAGITLSQQTSVLSKTSSDLHGDEENFFTSGETTPRGMSPTSENTQQRPVPLQAQTSQQTPTENMPLPNGDFRTPTKPKSNKKSKKKSPKKESPNPDENPVTSSSSSLNPPPENDGGNRVKKALKKIFPNNKRRHRSGDKHTEPLKDTPI